MDLLGQLNVEEFRYRLYGVGCFTFCFSFCFSLTWVMLSVARLIGVV